MSAAIIILQIISHIEIFNELCGYVATHFVCIHKRRWKQITYLFTLVVQLGGSSCIGMASSSSKKSRQLILWVMMVLSSHYLITISLRHLLGITLKIPMKADVKTSWNVVKFNILTQSLYCLTT